MKASSQEGNVCILPSEAAQAICRYEYVDFVTYLLRFPLLFRRTTTKLLYVLRTAKWMQVSIQPANSSQSIILATRIWLFYHENILYFSCLLFIFMMSDLANIKLHSLS